MSESDLEMVTLYGLSFLCINKIKKCEYCKCPFSNTQQFCVVVMYLLYDWTNFFFLGQRMFQ